ncbi:protein of unknown function [Nitrospina watsonii]|uniref:Uncharacterized protein n=1 Tax=Nitrospina watsonii TaxID=1323948 RepID=A0ABM9HG97_9BACT|nr:protein of unknown function [Nitrospina watsonii]
MLGRFPSEPAQPYRNRKRIVGSRVDPIHPVRITRRGLFDSLQDRQAGGSCQTLSFIFWSNACVAFVVSIDPTERFPIPVR